jgi:hypothetical protein
MEATMHSCLNAIFQRRAVRVFDPIEISPTLRDTARWKGSMPAGLAASFAFLREIMKSLW